MVEIGLLTVCVVLQIITVYILCSLRYSKHGPEGERAEKPAPRRFVTPFGSFAVESEKRKLAINDDETLYFKEQER